MKVAIFNPSRRKYLAKLISNLAVLSWGLIGTTEIIKSGLIIKLLLALGATSLTIIGTLVEPDEKGDG